MADNNDGLGKRIKEGLKRGFEGEVNRVEWAVRGEVNRARNEIDDLVGGIFTKKVKYTENADGSISRELKVGKQKIDITAARNDDGSYLVTDVPALDDKSMKKITEKINKGKHLSNDEQLWMNVYDKAAVAFALQTMGYEDQTATSHMPYTKEQLIGEQDIEAFSVDAKGFEGDKTAFLECVKKYMLAAYGNEAGAKHFEDFAAMSGLTEELQKLADKEKAAAEAQKPAAEKETPVVESAAKETPAAEKETPVVEPAAKETPAAEKETPVAEPAAKETPAAEKETPVVEPVAKETPIVEPVAKVKDDSARKDIHDTMKLDAAEKPQDVVVKDPKHSEMSLKEDMKNDGKVAAVRGLLGRRGVKLADKDDTLKKLVENYGAEAAYEVAMKCLIEPANVMRVMGEEFKRSGASLEYFAAIDPKDAAKMAKVAEVAGVPLKPVEKEVARPMYGPVSTKGFSPESITKGQDKVIAPVKLEVGNLMTERKYDEMCKKLHKDVLTVEDLADIGATRQDFEASVKKMLGDKATSADIQGKVEKGFGLEGSSPVTKDFAVEVIGRVEDRKMLALRSRGKSH